MFSFGCGMRFLLRLTDEFLFLLFPRTYKVIVLWLIKNKTINK